MDDATFLRRTLIVGVLVVAAALIWMLGSLLLLLFGAIVIAVVIRSAGNAIAAHSRLSPRWASVVVVLITTLAFVAMVMLVGDEVATQFGELQNRLPQAYAKVSEWVERSEFGQMLFPQLGDVESGEGEGVSAAGAAKTVAITVTAISHTVVVILIAIYLSFNPGLYTRGVLALVPPKRRPAVAEALDLSSTALRKWLVGQSVSMVLVGTMVGVGLWLIGVPLALALGILAGVLEFVPIAGPFIAAVPGILLAFAVSPLVAAYALGVYLIVQQLEGGLISPLAQRWSVSLPPALGLFAIVVFGMLFGIPGLLFATPLTVVLMVLVQKFWVVKS
ncbi:MAG: AI-2E family transporter [Xanthomonadaceae bacterium]|nr:AI-2E family transporter [Xanthomonadaceae bacterium]